MKQNELTTKDIEIMGADDWSTYSDQEIAALARKEHERQKRLDYIQITGDMRKKFASSAIYTLDLLARDCSAAIKRTPRKMERLKLSNARVFFQDTIHDFKKNFQTLAEFAGWWDE